MAFDWRLKEATAHSANCAICACPAAPEDEGAEALSRHAALALPAISFLGDAVSTSAARRAPQPVGILQCATCVVTCHRRCVATLSAVWGERAIVGGFQQRDASEAASTSKVSRRIRARAQSGGVTGSSAANSAAAAWRCHLCRCEDRVDCRDQPPAANSEEEEEEVEGGHGDEGAAEYAAEYAAVPPPTRAANTDVTARGAVIAGISLGASVALDGARLGTVSAFRAAAALSGSGTGGGSGGGGDGGGAEPAAVPTFEIKLEDGSTVEMAHEPLFKRLWENSQGGAAASTAAACTAEAAVEATVEAAQGEAAQVEAAQVEVKASVAPPTEAVAPEVANEAAAPEAAAAPGPGTEAAAREATAREATAREATTREAAAREAAAPEAETSTDEGAATESD